MKKNFVLMISLLLLSFSLSYSQTNRLENYQIASFNGVTRVSLTFTRRPITNILKESDHQRLTIHVPHCVLGNVPGNFTTPDMFASILVVSTPARDLSITITTTQFYELIRQYGSQGRQYTMHIDIIRTITPTRIEDTLSLLDYYHYIGNRDSVNEVMQSAQALFPNHPELINRTQNRFRPPTIYAPQPTRTQITQTPTVQRPSQTTSTQTTTTQRQTTQTQQQGDLPTTITHVPPVQQQIPPTPPPTNEQTQQTTTQTPPILPQTTNDRNIDQNDVSFTLITRHDRFPTRIPQTKPIFAEPEPEPIWQPEPEPESEPEREPEPVHIPEPVWQPEPEIVRQPDPEPIRQVEQPQIIYRDVTDTSGMTETEKLIVEYYHVASIDSILVTFLVGASANIVGDFQNAIHFLSQVPPTDVNYENALRLLQDSYFSIGDTVNANFYASLLNTEDEPVTDLGFINTPIALWMAGILGGIALIIGFVLAAISIGAKKSNKQKEESRRQSVPEEDYSRHVTNIQRAYDNKQINTPSQTVEEIENSESLAAHYDAPPIVTEELTPQEKQELKEEEKMDFRFNNVQKPEPQTNTINKFEDEDDYETFGDDEYRKNLVLKLYNDGWKLEEIAKELQISQREIDLIVKLSG